MVLSHEFHRELHLQLRVRELELPGRALDVLHFAPRGQEVTFLVVGRVDPRRLLEPDVVRGIELVRCASEDRCKGGCACSHFDLLSVQSALMPAAWMMGVQRASSALTHSPSSSDEPGAAATPCLRNVSCVSGARRTSPISRLSLATIARGVFAGAKSPNQSFTSIPGMPASTALGMSGAPAKRVAEDTASALTFPAFNCPCAVSGERNDTGTSPASTAVSALPALLYGMCCSGTPVTFFKSSPARWLVEPLPAEPYARSPFCLA